LSNPQESKQNKNGREAYRHCSNIPSIINAPVRFPLIWIIPITKSQEIPNIEARKHNGSVAIYLLNVNQLMATQFIIVTVFN